MIIGNLSLECMAALPAEANPVLAVDADTVLSGSISLQPLKAVRRWRGKVPNFSSAIDLDKPPKSHCGDLLKPPDTASLENRFGVYIAKRPDQAFSIPCLALYAERNSDR